VYVVSASAAAGCAVCYGLASVLQARGARSVGRARGVDPRLLVRLARSAWSRAGVALDCVGFALQLLALRSLPLFVVQTAVSSSLAVTAAAAALILREHLGPREWGAVAAISAGLAMLGISAGEQGARPAPHALYVGLVITVACLVVMAVASRWLPEPGRPAWLGAGAGLAWGVVALSIRSVESLSPSRLLTDVATYLVIIGGILGFLLYATALQGDSVTAATAALVVGETLVPALIGIALLGDRARPGTALIAAVGFLLAVAGALVLSRFGQPEHLAEAV
jgi:drug/metabolite transporter (DMT)-like permease